MRISDWSSDVCSSDLDLGKVERVETIILRSRIGHDLDGKRPARIIAARDRVEQVAAVEIGVVTGHATGLRIAEEFHALLGVEVVLHTEFLAPGIDPHLGVRTVAVHVPPGARPYARARSEASSVGKGCVSQS